MAQKKCFFDAFAKRRCPVENQILRSTVNDGGDRLSKLLINKTPDSLLPQEIRTRIEGNLWMLTPQAFLYFLPAFLQASLEHYERISVFASELIDVLTKPERADILNVLDKLGETPDGLGLPIDIADPLREQQLEWFESGTPGTIFQERFGSLTQEEGGAILNFLIAFKQAYGMDFPFNELDVAIERYWFGYQTL